MADRNTFVSPVMVDGKLQTILHALGRWLKGKLDAIDNPPRAALKRAAVQSITSGVSTLITWDDPATYDSALLWNAATPTKLTAPVAGTYHAVFTAAFGVNTTGARLLEVMKNGVTMATFANSAGSWLIGGSVAVDMKLAVGDYVECRVFQNSGVNVNIDNTVPIVFSVHHIGN